MFYLIIILVVLFIFRHYLKRFFLKYDNTIVFTGGLGSGKTYNAYVVLRKLYRKLLNKVFVYNLFHKNKFSQPIIYSNVIFNEKKIHKNCKRLDLKPEHLLLQERIDNPCIVLMDEISTFCSQFDFKNPNVCDNFDEFMRLFRHYTLGGYFVGTEQCSENIVLQIRRRLNQVYNVRGLRVHFGLFYSCEKRLISISEEIKTIEQGDQSEAFKKHIGLALPNHTYNSYCFYERYKSVPKGIDLITVNKELCQVHTVKCPANKVPKLTKDTDTYQITYSDYLNQMEKNKKKRDKRK